MDGWMEVCVRSTLALLISYSCVFPAVTADRTHSPDVCSDRSVKQSLHIQYILCVMESKRQNVDRLIQYIHQTSWICFCFWWIKVKIPLFKNTSVQQPFLLLSGVCVCRLWSEQRGFTKLCIYQTTTERLLKPHSLPRWGFHSHRRSPLNPHKTQHTGSTTRFHWIITVRGSLVFPQMSTSNSDKWPSSETLLARIRAQSINMKRFVSVALIFQTFNDVISQMQERTMNNSRGTPHF